MMREDIRRARVKQYGSFLYCPQRDTICSCMDNELAICSRTICLYEDPDWQAEQETINRNRSIAAQASKQKEEAPVIKATTMRAMTLRQKIEKEEELAARLFKRNKPRAAQMVLNRAMIMRGDLKK